MTKKRDRTNFSSPVMDVWKRELGQLSTRNFANRLAASEDLVLRLDMLHKLDKHRGCVNTVSFNQAGDILVSGSDDRRIILWDWESGHIKHSFHSGHHNNVFQAKFMPYTDDREVVTCSADGQVRHAQIHECGKVTNQLISVHQGRIHKLAVEPGSPHIFYTCGEDGLVQHIDLRTSTATRLFTCRSLPYEINPHHVHLNAITIDPRNPNLFAVGGSDQFARLYDIRQYDSGGSSELDRPIKFICPPHLMDDEDSGNVGITGLAFSDECELLVSYNDEFIYLFNKDNGLGPLTFHPESDADTVYEKKLPAPQAYKGHRNRETVKGVNFYGPKCEYVVSGSDCGRIFIWKKKGGELIRVIEADKHVVNCIESHPHIPVLASSGLEHNIKIWTPKAIDRAILPTNIGKDRGRMTLHGTGFFLHAFHDDEDDSDGGFIYTTDEEDDDDVDSDDDDNYDDDDDDSYDDGDNDDGNESDFDADGRVNDGEGGDGGDEMLSEHQLENERDGEGNGVEFLDSDDNDDSIHDSGSEADEANKLHVSSDGCISDGTLGASSSADMSDDFDDYRDNNRDFDDSDDE